MGQQQLLLIVLGVILVGVAVVLGIQYFAVGAEEGAKDELVAHNLTIGANAQQWFKKPVSMGGGGGTFIGFTENAWTGKLALRLGTTENAVSYEPSGEALDEITITATPKANLNYKFTSVVTIVTPDGMTTEVKYPQ